MNSPTSICDGAWWRELVPRVDPFESKRIPVEVKILGVAFYIQA